MCTCSCLDPGSPSECPPTTTPTQTEIRIIDDLGQPTSGCPTTKAILEISNRVTTADLPSDFTTASTDRDNFKIDVFDDGVSGDTIPAAEVELEILKPGPAGPQSFSPRRTLNVELKRVGTTDWFRSKYLRLVVDDVDKNAVPDQTLLADWDPSDETVEILGQIIRTKYTGSNGTEVTASAELGANRTWINVAVHILRATVGGAGVVTLDQARLRIRKWFRRVYAQIDMAPRLVETTRLVDPMENLVSISNNTGNDATGGASLSGIKFDIKSGATTVTIGPHIPSAGRTAMQTADALAQLINSEGTFSARTIQNPPTLEATATKGSADILITKPDGGRVTIDNLTFDDPSQSVTVGRVTPTGFVGWFAAVPQTRDWVVGSIQQRTVLHNFDTGSDRIDMVVIDTFSSSARGQAMMPGTIYAAGKQAISSITMSGFVASATMDGSESNPYSCPHEAGHDLLDAIHASDTTQLMKGPTSGTNVVDGTKRISESGINFDDPASSLVQESRIRSKASSVLTSW